MKQMASMLAIQLDFQMVLLILMAVIPIAGTMEWKYVLTAFFSTFAIASAAFFFTKRWFEREEVFFRM